MHTLQRLSLCSVCSPAHTFATCASRAAPLSAHTPHPWGRACGLPSESLSSHPSTPKGERSHLSHAASLPSCAGLPPQDRRRKQCWQGMVCRMRPGLAQALPRTQSNRCKAGTKSGGSHYFGLGHFQSLAVLRVTQRLARSPVALHIPFLSMNEWSNLAGGHCKTQ